MKRFIPFLGVLLVTIPAAAQNRICQSINGRTQCFEGEGSLSCRTVNDRTECTRGPAMAPPAIPPMEIPALPPHLQGLIDKDATVTVEGGRVRVRSGGVDIRVD